MVNKTITIRANQAWMKRLLLRPIENVQVGHTNPKAPLNGSIKPVLLPNGLSLAMEKIMTSTYLTRLQMVDPATLYGWSVDAAPRNDLS